MICMINELEDYKYNFMHTTSNLKATPFEQGFLNLSKQYIELVGNHLESITIYIGNNREPIRGTLYTDNPVDVPRIRGGKVLHNWFQENCEIDEILNVSILNPVTFWVYKNN